MCTLTMLRWQVSPKVSSVSPGAETQPAKHPIIQGWRGLSAGAAGAAVVCVDASPEGN